MEPHLRPSPVGGHHRLWLCIALCLPAVAACGSDSDDSGAYVLPSGANDGGQATPTDAAAAGTASDATLADTAAPADAGPPNEPPKLLPIDSIVLDQGASTTVDLNPLLSDDHDAKHALVTSWSADHVALKDPAASHILYVVAPTQWAGVEVIDLKVTDSGGLSAVQTLAVTVKEVVVVAARPVADCGLVTFSYPAGKGEHVVLLSGDFNGWAATADKADKLLDLGKTGTWTLDKVLDPGVHQYKFLVDGEWKADPNNPNQTADGFGGHNSVIKVAPCAQ